MLSSLFIVVAATVVAVAIVVAVVTLTDNIGGSGVVDCKPLFKRS